MRAHGKIRADESEAYAGVFSLNFTKQAFFDRDFDALTTRARGLYIDGENREIVSRSYEKFFNIGEREDAFSLMP